LALGRLTLGSVLLGALLLTRGWTKPARGDLGLLADRGPHLVRLYNVVLNDAERRVDAGTASMLVMIAPIVVVALAAVFLKERFTRTFLLGGAWRSPVSSSSASRLLGQRDLHRCNVVASRRPWPPRSDWWRKSPYSAACRRCK